MTRIYSGSGSIVVVPPTIKASKPWGKRNYNLTNARCSVVTVTDKHGNTRTVAPLVKGQVVRLNRRTYKVAMAGQTNRPAPDLTEAQQDAILAQLRANAQPLAKGFNIHDK